MDQVTAPGDTLKVETVDGYLEVLDRASTVTARLAVSELPITVGRGYDNDLVVADPFVCAHHLKIKLSDVGEIVADDLASVNGLFGHNKKKRRQTCILTSGEPIRFGHTRLRYRAKSFQVSATLADYHTRNALELFELPGVQAFIFAVTLLTLWANGFLDSVEKRDTSQPAFELIVPVLIIAFWAGLWAFAGRVVTHRIKFLSHCAIVSGALTTVLLFDGLVEYIAFSFAIDEIRSSLSLAASLLVANAMLYAHLRVATLSSPWRLGFVSVAIACAVFGLLSLKGRIESDDFSAAPNLSATLKAPQFKIAKPQSSDEFFAELHELHERIREASQVNDAL
jgi:hypothetical protein